jgi:hypothetical protein
MWERETAGRALVAERQGQVVGIIAVTAIPYLEREGRRGRIVALVVSSACYRPPACRCRRESGRRA